MVSTLAAAFEHSPSEANFGRLQEAILELVKMTRQDGLTDDDPAMMKSKVEQKAGRDATSLKAAGNRGPVQQVHESYNRTININIVKATGGTLRQLGLDSSERDRDAIEAMLKTGSKPRQSEGSAQPTVTWRLTPSVGRYLAIPFEPSASTRITNNFDMTPFANGARKVRLELANVRPEDAKLFRAHVKSDKPFRTDRSRQVNPGINPRNGQEFLIGRPTSDDRGYYLAWRGEGISREEFAERNPNAVIILRLMD